MYKFCKQEVTGSHTDRHMTVAHVDQDMIVNTGGSRSAAIESFTATRQIIQHVKVIDAFICQ